MFDILSENNINFYSQHLEKRKKQIKDERASWINKNNNLLKVLKISSGETNQFYNKIKEHSTVRDDYDNLTNDIFQLKKIYEQLKSIHNDIKIKENKVLQVEREKEKREEEIKLRLLEKEQRTKDILNKIGYLIVILGPLIGVIYYLLNFNRFESTIWTYYLPSTIIFVSFFIGSLFKSLSSPNVLSKIHHIFGICLIAPLIYLAVILVVAIILLIPAFIAMIIWDSSTVDKITDWVLTAGYFLTVLLEWGASFNIFHESD
jgi:membrane-associated HD superfamily phosphohydrolase